MTRFLLLALPVAATAACYSGVGALHDVHVDVAKGEWEAMTQAVPQTAE